MAISRDELIKILAGADPMGLIAQGGLADEHARETDAILDLQGVIQLTETTSIFTVSFGEPFGRFRAADD